MEPMSNRCRVILRKSRRFLVQDLDLGIVDYLVSELIITQDDEERIAAEKVNSDKARKLLELLARKGQRAYNVFVRVLKERQKYLYDNVRAVESQSDQDKPRGRHWQTLIFKKNI